MSGFHIYQFLIVFFFVISSSRCDVVLFIILCEVVWFRIFLLYSFGFYSKIDFSQSYIFNQWFWHSTFQIQKHDYPLI